MFISDILSFSISHKQRLHTSLYCSINNAKRSKILLKVIERIYEQHLDMRDIIDSLLVDVYKEENVSPEKDFLLVFIKIDFFLKSRRYDLLCVEKTV